MASKHSGGGKSSSDLAGLPPFNSLHTRDYGDDGSHGVHHRLIFCGVFGGNGPANATFEHVPKRVLHSKTREENALDGYGIVNLGNTTNLLAIGLGRYELPCRSLHSQVPEAGKRESHPP